MIRFPRLAISRWLLGAAPVLYGLCYLFPWEIMDRNFYGWDWWRQLWMMVRISPKRITVLAILAGFPLQMIAVPFVIPALRGSSVLRWIARGFAILMVWQTVGFLRSSRFYMAYLEEWSRVGMGRWLEMISFCLYAVGLLLLPPLAGKGGDPGHDSAAGSR